MAPWWYLAHWKVWRLHAPWRSRSDDKAYVTWADSRVIAAQPVTKWMSSTELLHTCCSAVNGFISAVKSDILTWDSEEWLTAGATLKRPLEAVQLHFSALQVEMSGNGVVSAAGVQSPNWQRIFKSPQSVILSFKRVLASLFVSLWNPWSPPWLIATSAVNSARSLIFKKQLFVSVQSVFVT